MASKASSKSGSNASTTSRVADAAHEAVDQVAGQAEAAEARVRDAAGEAQARLKANADAARDRGKAVVGNVQALVHDHPVASLGVAFLAGVVLASVMRR